MAEEKHLLRRWRHRLVSAWLLIAIAPAIPLLVVLVTLRLWELAWPLILVIIVMSVLVIGYRLHRAKSWRWH